MKLRLLILLAAAALAAAPAAGQTIKSLGYNTTNGNIVAATNVTFTNSVGFATNARAATRTNLGGTTVGNAVFTATNAQAAAAAVGLGVSNAVEFSTVFAASIGSPSFLSDGSLNEADLPISFSSGAEAGTRTNLGLGLPALTNTSNVAAMRALAGSVNTNEPYSGTVALTNTNVLTFSNGVLLKIQ